MPTKLPEPQRHRERRLTGLAVFGIVVAFFASVIAVNGVMAYLAVTTLGGVRTPSAYKAGLDFAADVAAAERQDALHWRMDGHVREIAGSVVVEVEPKDAAGQPLAGLAVEVTLEHPIDERRDRHVRLAETAPGTYTASVQAAPGAWDVIIEAGRDGGRSFRSESRVVLGAGS
jgi:nitrogen fixation protein FixH